VIIVGGRLGRHRCDEGDEGLVRVFLSYRRSDAGGYAGRLADTLAGRLGPKSVFQDVSAIAPGQDFELAIDRALDSSDAVLAVIGPDWLATDPATGDRRLNQPGDYVRLELARALERDVSVVPVLVGGAPLPEADDLPGDLRGLVQRQDVVLHDPTWHEDVDGVLRSLRGEPVVPAGRVRRWIGATAVAGLVVAGSGAWWWQARDSSGSEDGIDPCPTADGDGWHSLTLGADPAAEVAYAGDALVFTVTDAKWRSLESGRWLVTLDTAMDNDSAEELQHGEWYYKSLVVAQRQFDVSCFSADPAFVEPTRVGDAVAGFEVRCEPAGLIELEVSLEETVGSMAVTGDSEPGNC
jgi:TIR domain